MARFYIYDGSKYVPASADTLTFTGAVTDSYDGSTAKTVEIPQGNVQPDWNQNNETAADHVKNRPFYTGDRVQTVLVEESTISFSKLSEGFYVAEFPSTFTATVGETYTVYWDGTAYECICANFESASYLGNPSIIDAGADTGEPFTIALYSASMKEIYTTDSSAAHTISISGFAEEVVKIDAKYLPFPFKPDGKSYLTFSSPNSFTLETATHTKTWDGTLEYFASNETWTIWDGASALPAAANGGEYVLYLRGTGNTAISGSSEWSLSGSNIACIGNIENLLDYATVELGEHPTMANDCYNGMFGFCTSLTQAPELPATTLADGCYANMFNYCTGLAQAPELPSTTLARSCYNSMFYHCTSLTQAPALPATTLADSCYTLMFAGCTSLTHLPALPATTLTEYCYQSMFVDCSSLKLSENKTGEYIQEYRIPSSGDGVTSANALNGMFHSTGGTFTGDPQINTTYYLSSENMIVRGTEIANLNGYVESMIDAALVGAVKSVNGQTGVVTLNANDISTTKLPPTNILNFVIDGAFDEGLVELTRNGASASANDFISAINSGSTVTIGLNDQGNPKVTFDERPVKYKITGDTLSLCFIAEKGHTYTPAIYVLSGTTSGTTVSTLVEHNFTDSFYQENYVSANDLPVQAPLTVEEYFEELESRIAALQSKSITDSGGYYTTDTVEGALQEIGAELAGINTLLGSGIQISFTIEDAHCTANAGQTFSEWIGSGYKTLENGMMLSVPYGDDGVIFLDEAGVYALSLDGNTPVHGGDKIISGGTYTSMHHGG